MAISEVFPHPTVKQVIFQVRFPNLFSIENRIGDFQLKIMEKFPDSALLVRRQVIMADFVPGEEPAKIPSDSPDDASNKIWRFKSENKVVLNVHTNSLDINSEFHKTYNNPGIEDRFRDTIEFVVNAFLETTRIPKISRLGLRYIDDCPMPEKTSDEFLKYYNTTFPLGRFSLEDATEMLSRFTLKNGSHFVRYMETLQETEDGIKYYLDFDGYSNDVAAADYLETTDKLHEMISDEYEKTIREPVFKYMRTGEME